MTSELVDYSYKITLFLFCPATEEEDRLVAYRQEDVLRLTVNNC